MVESVNDDKCWRECKIQGEHYVCEKDYIWNSSTCVCQNRKYLRSIISDSVIRCDEIKEVTKNFAYLFINCHITFDNC